MKQTNLLFANLKDVSKYDNCTYLVICDDNVAFSIF